MQLPIVYSVNILLVVTAFSELAHLFQYFFANDCLKNFLYKILGFLSPKLGTNDSFTMTKDSIYLLMFWPSFLFESS